MKKLILNILISLSCFIPQLASGCEYCAATKEVCTQYQTVCTSYQNQCTSSSQVCSGYQTVCTSYDDYCTAYDDNGDCISYATECTGYATECTGYTTQCDHYENVCVAYGSQCTETETQCTSYYYGDYVTVYGNVSDFYTSNGISGQSLNFSDPIGHTSTNLSTGAGGNYSGTVFVYDDSYGYLNLQVCSNANASYLGNCQEVSLPDTCMSPSYALNFYLTEAPPAVPTAKVLYRSQNGIQLSLSNGGGIVTGFTVGIAAGNTFPSCSQTNLGNVSQYDFTSLQPNTTYSISLCAYNNVSYGSPANFRIQTAMSFSAVPAAGLGNPSNVFQFGSAPFAGQIQFVDVTGDKKPDMVYQAADNAFYLSRLTGDGFADPVKVAQHGGNFVNGQAKYADINGDGKADLIFQGMDNAFYLSLSTGSGFQNPVKVFQHGGTFVYGQAQYADFNGDGKADLIFQAPDNSFYVSLSTGSGFGTAVKAFQHGGNFVLGQAQYGDMNGDGKADLLFQSLDNSFFVSLSNGTVFGTAVKNLQHGGSYTYGQAQYADINGDGKIDLVFQGLDNTFWLSLSNGSVFTSPVRTIQHGGPYNAGQAQYADMDGDGKADLLFQGVNNYFYISASTGTGFSQAVQMAQQAGNFKPGSVRYIDFNNDRKADFLFNAGDGNVYGSYSGINASIGSVPDLSGTWYINAKACAISQNGSNLVFTNEFGNTAQGSFKTSLSVVATGWGSLVGTLSTDNKTISWANDTKWVRVPAVNPDISGSWYIGNKLCSISQNGSALSITNEAGDTVSGSFTSTATVVASGWGNLVGNLTSDNQTINWANGSKWSRTPTGTVTLPNLAGTWYIGSKACAISQNGATLSFYQ